MLVGVYIFSSFIASLQFDAIENNLLDNSTQNTRDRVDYIRKKYQLNGKSCLNLELLITKSKNVTLMEEFELIDKLPHVKKQEIFENI